ncbi:hypothetical protein DFH06DRAFT_1186491 [Mycena polygramma]|nr:hypothetical protein DFH06DRAFT_1186491 [Mycena polygramma]
MPSYVVTGATGGIGFEYVRQLSAESQNAVFAIVGNKRSKVAAKLHALSRRNITVISADVNDPSALEIAAASVARVTIGSLDYLINTAGKSNHPGLALDQFPDPETLEDDLIDIFKANTISVVHLINAFLPLLRNSRTKKVVVLSSGLADLDFTLSGETAAEPSYSISKAALNMVVAKYAAQFKSEGFVFLALSPGLVNVPDTGPVTAKAVDELVMISKAIAKVAPDFKGPMPPEESVRMQLEVIYRWTVQETGAFVSHLGTKQWL